MKVRHGDPLPRSFSDHPAGGKIVAETDILIRGCDVDALERRRRPGRLAAKLLIFRNSKDMGRFAMKALGSPNYDCAGFVNNLSVERMRFGKGGVLLEHTLSVDPRYFCIICLNQETGLNMEVITHEAVHAGFFYSRRSRMKWPGQKGQPDEAVCYPAGIIAAAINRFVHDEGLYA